MGPVGLDEGAAGGRAVNADSGLKQCKILTCGPD